MGKEETNKDRNFDLGLREVKASLHEKINLYKTRAREVEQYLSKKPEEWGKFQNEANLEIDGIFRDIMNFEKINLNNGCGDRVYKLKHLFVKRIRKLFERGQYGKWSIIKPYGYAGDFKIIDDIYQNDPSTTGFDRLLDNYFQMSAISVAVRNRKEDFKRLIIKFINEQKVGQLRIMSLASGSCRDIGEILSSKNLSNKNVFFDCYDNETGAIEFAKSLLNTFENINFIKENALKIAAAKNISSRIKEKYNLIYTTGLFDYLSDKIAVSLTRNLRALLKKDGVLAVSNVRDKYSNPSVYYMEWIGDWNLIYRDDNQFRKIFLDAGFRKEELRCQYEQQGIMQYSFVTKK